MVLCQKVGEQDRRGGPLSVGASEPYNFGFWIADFGLIENLEWKCELSDASLSSERRVLLMAAVKSFVDHVITQD